jgi:hypothetical protein
LDGVRDVPVTWQPIARASWTTAVPTPRDERVPGGRERLRDRARVPQVHAGRHPRGLALVNDDLLGVRAPADDAEHAIAHGEPAHVGADLDDLTGVLEPGDVGRRAGRRRVEPHPLEEIGAVQARPAHADAHVRRRQGRRGQVDELEDLGPAGLTDADGAHPERIAPRVC